MASSNISSRTSGSGQWAPRICSFRRSPVPTPRKKEMAHVLLLPLRRAIEEETMFNQDIQATWQYHNGTKHPNGSLLNPRHRYDPADRPPLFKVYPQLAPIPLPLDRSPRGFSALAAIARTIPPTEGQQRPDLGAVARLLYFSAGITKQLRTPWGTIPFRAAACTGALYHIELYLVCGDLPELQAGVYHCGPGDFALRCLRQGDYRQLLVQATGGEPAVAAAPLTVICTGTF